MFLFSRCPIKNTWSLEVKNLIRHKTMNTTISIFMKVYSKHSNTYRRCCFRYRGLAGLLRQLLVPVRGREVVLHALTRLDARTPCLLHRIDESQTWTGIVLRGAGYDNRTPAQIVARFLFQFVRQRLQERAARAQLELGELFCLVARILCVDQLCE